MDNLVAQFEQLLKQHSHASIKKALNEALNRLPKQKVVVNGSYGGYGFSPEAYDWMVQQGYTPRECDDRKYFHPDRNHPLAVAAVETLGTAANGHCASLHIEEIPQGVSYRVEEYDGIESIVW